MTAHLLAMPSYPPMVVLMVVVVLGSGSHSLFQSNQIVNCNHFYIVNWVYLFIIYIFPTPIYFHIYLFL